jgi:hypothetical protein
MSISKASTFLNRRVAMVAWAEALKTASARVYATDIEDRG